MGDEDVGKVAEKLHKQFGHPTAEKLVDLVHKAGVKNKALCEAIRNFSRSCQVCVRLKRPSPRPVVSIPLASKFNDAVAIDLKFWGNKYFLVLVDIATRYCTAVVIENKRPSTIIRGIFLSWIVMFGAPKKILSDNGCEFNNAEMRDLGERFNVRLMTTAAESPFSNGICERQNAVIGHGVRKVMADTNCTVDVALAWTISARNCLANHSGFSANQLVFGRNPALPNVFCDRLPALEETSSSDIVRNNLNAMHVARQQFMKFESSERLRRALRHNVRPTDGSNIASGDEVYYKRNESPEWRGPGIVIGRDGKVFIVKHGGTYVRVHVCRISRAPCGVDKEDEQLSSVGPSTSTQTNLREEQGESSEGAAHRNAPDDSEDELYNTESSQVDSGASEEQQPKESSQDESATVNEVDVLPTGSSSFQVKVGQRLRGVLCDSGEVFSGKVVSRGGKTTGRYKHWYNVEREDGTTQSINMKEGVRDLEEVCDDAEMLVFFNSSEVTEAKQRELASWRENKVYEEVENTGQEIITVRWVVTEKIKDGKTVVKARLVARGFEENTDSLRKDSPTCSKEAVRLAISVASSRGWECNAIDVKSAYLQGNAIGRDVFLRPPPEYDSGTLWKLNKTVYGLSDAARMWYLRVKEELLLLGMSISSLDPALFSWHADGELSGVICLYVDDFLWAGSSKFKEKVISNLSSMFQIGSTSSKAFKYIGLNVAVTAEGCTTIDQSEYTQSIQPVTVSRQRAMVKSSDLSNREKLEYRALVGQLNWVATHTRPDIAFDVCELSVNYKEATVGDLLRLNKVVARVKTDQLKLFYPKMNDLSDCHIDCYADASFGNLPGCGSQGGLIVFLRDSSGNSCPIFWQSRKIRRVVKSTLAAETLALLDCANAGVYIKQVLMEISGCSEMSVNCYTDNKSLLDTLNSNKYVDDRRLRIDLAVLQDMFQRKEITKIVWVDSSHQLANCLTKRGASAEHLRASISRE